MDYLDWKFERAQPNGPIPVWGSTEGLCVWCEEPAVTSYQDVDAKGDDVEYQVCKTCYEDQTGEEYE